MRATLKCSAIAVTISTVRGCIAFSRPVRQQRTKCEKSLSTSGCASPFSSKKANEASSWRFSK